MHMFLWLVARGNFKGMLSTFLFWLGGIENKKEPRPLPAIDQKKLRAHPTMQCSLSLCPSFLHKTPAPKRPRETDGGPRRDRATPKRRRTATTAPIIVSSTRPGHASLTRGRVPARDAAPQRHPLVDRQPSPSVAQACDHVRRVSILLDYLGTLVADDQCEVFGVNINGARPCYLTVRRGLPCGSGLVWTLQSSWSDVCNVTNTVDTATGALDAAAAGRTVRSASCPSGEISAIVDTRLPAGISSDTGSVSVICRRWAEMRDTAGAAYGGSRLWVGMNSFNRGHSAASMRALGVLATGTDRQWVHPGPLTMVEVPLDQAWDNWNDGAIRLAAEYLQSLSFALASQLSAAPPLPTTRCLLAS
ncbi:hypothetical protein pclt_cds_1032 [Pandoravirus celtis]|uniref:Uncharacterized protein n=1 Tax=Pandoravirus celtis TaxID=2568002 RepID=A0A4D6EJE1_9VIRU|nr:hypothetical protein pclt_cds_1032 [Pandoravirus celtis]